LPDFTVAICTFRRADVLPVTLDSLTRIEQPDASWELLIVDNDCDPAVEQIVKQFEGKLPIRYTSESQTGIARARNKAVMETRSPFILFADDDVLFDPHWLVNMTKAVTVHSDCDFWGGRIDPTFEAPPPPWFDMEICPMMGDAIVRYDSGGEPRYWDPSKDPPFYTCNLGLRVDTVRKAGMFNETMGHMGKKRGTGEDTWMIKSISRAGGKGWYAADALLHHPVPPQRMTRSFLRAFAWRQGCIGVEMIVRELHPQGEPVGRPPRWLFRLAGEQLFRGMGQWLGGLFTLSRARLFAGQFRTLFNLSKIKHGLTGRYDR